MNRIYILLILILISCSNKEKTLTETERWKQHAANTEIIRDDFGVPHIYGKTDADAVFGLLYAQCEDDFNRVERNYILAIGRLAEVEGEKSIYSDLRARLYMTKKEAIDNYNKSPKWLKDLCVAFADGINYYLSKHPEVKPKLLTHFEPWMPMYFSEGSIGGDIERVSTRKIKEFYDKSNSDLAVINDGLLRLADNEPRGSNGIAISVHTKDITNHGVFTRVSSDENPEFNDINDIINKRSEKNIKNLANKNSSISYSLVDREHTFLPTPVYLCEYGGKIVINITVDSNGNVIDAYVNSSSASSNGCLIDSALEYAKAAIFSINPAKPSQLGTITFLFKGKN